MADRMAQIPMTFSEVEGYFCSDDWQSVSRGPSVSAELLVYPVATSCDRSAASTCVSLRCRVNSANL